MGKIKENIWLLVLQMLLTVIGLIIFSSYTKSTESASVSYVDKENSKQDVVCLKSKDDLQDQIDKKADKEDVDDIKKTLKTMDKRIYDLWTVRDK